MTDAEAKTEEPKAEEPKKEEETKEEEGSGLPSPPKGAPMSLMDQIAAMSVNASKTAEQATEKSKELDKKVTRQRRKSRDLEQVVFGMNVMEVGALRKIFDEIDEDKSGTIEVGELKDALVKAGKKPTEAQVKKLLTTYDSSGTGSLSFEDYRKMIADWDKFEDQMAAPAPAPAPA